MDDSIADLDSTELDSGLTLAVEVDSECEDWEADTETDSVGRELEAADRVMVTLTVATLVNVTVAIPFSFSSTLILEDGADVMLASTEDRVEEAEKEEVSLTAEEEGRGIVSFRLAEAVGSAD